jgi:CDP-diglyceride synthetase
MEWQIIVAMVLAVPIILLPVAFVWYLDIGGILAGRKARRQKAATEAAAEEVVS